MQKLPYFIENRIDATFNLFIIFLSTGFIYRITIPTEGELQWGVVHLFVSMLVVAELTQSKSTYPCNVLLKQLYSLMRFKNPCGYTKLWLNSIYLYLLPAKD